MSQGNNLGPLLTSLGDYKILVYIFTVNKIQPVKHDIQQIRMIFQKYNKSRRIIENTHIYP